MSAEANKALVRRFFEEVNDLGRVEVLDTIAANNIIIHEPTVPGGLLHGRDAIKGLVGLFHTAFPGHRTTIEQMVAEGDMVTVLHTHHATHTGDFIGIPPTGKAVTVHGLEAFRVSGGWIAEFWRHDDDLGLMQQLGAIPTPEAAPAA